MEPFGRETFGRTILMGVLKLEVKDVLCLQANPLEGAYDVVLHTEGKHDKVMGRVKVVEKARPMCHYEVASLARNSFRVVTVNMFNPHVKEEEVRAFLGRYMDNVSSARLLKDTLGFWNGRRSFQALLKEDPGGLGGYLHPPALFSLGADRGTLFYARQPPFCRRCMTYGHNFASCGGRKCRVCGSGAHKAKDCGEQKKCHGTSVEGLHGSPQVVCSGCRGGSRCRRGGWGMKWRGSSRPEPRARGKSGCNRGGAGKSSGKRGGRAEDGRNRTGRRGGNGDRDRGERRCQRRRSRRRSERCRPQPWKERRRGEGRCRRGGIGRAREGEEELREMREELGVRGREGRGGGGLGIGRWAGGRGGGEASNGREGEEAPTALTPPNAQLPGAPNGGWQGGAEDAGSPVLFPTVFWVDGMVEDGGEPRDQGTREPNTIPASWAGEMEESGGTPEGGSEAPLEEMVQGSIR
ncbi:unnamed protein product [Coregonus sp. 'balchen']|nr:unnamed protein product [Coregonus sp. 'balchen']